MTADAPLTPSSPDWGTIVCDYCQQAPVSVAGYVCWNCQSYVEYLEGPFCECPHNLFQECLCELECEEDCPAWPERAAQYSAGVWSDGEEASQPRVAPERSDGEG